MGINFFRNSVDTNICMYTNLERKVIELTAVSERICFLQMRGVGNNVTIICAHAHTKYKEEEEKTDFILIWKGCTVKRMKNMLKLLWEILIQK